MPFKKMDLHKLPPRQWLLLGYPGCGKSTFSAQMETPILPIDADHRYVEVATLAKGDVLEFFDTDQSGDYTDVQQIVDLLHKNMPGSGIKTIVVDSLTGIITPKTTQAVMDNDAGKNKNRITAFKDKALSMRLLQDTLTGFDVDTLWIAHLRTSMSASTSKEAESATVSAVELARLRRSLNIEMRVIEAQDGTRGIQIDWARNGRNGIKIWDESGTWQGMPEKIEEAVYGGLSKADMEKFAKQTPTGFASSESAIAWGFDQNCFRDAVHAKNAYDKIKEEKKPQTSGAMWKLWIEDVERRKVSGVVEDDKTVKELTSEIPAVVVAEMPVDQVDPPVDEHFKQPDQPPTIWNTLSELYGEQLDLNSRQLMAAWMIRKYTLNATPTQIRDNEGSLTGEEIAAVIDALRNGSARYLKNFLAEQTKLAQEQEKKLHTVPA